MLKISSFAVAVGWWCSDSIANPTFPYGSVLNAAIGAPVQTNQTDAAITANNSLSATTTVQSNQKTVQTILLQTVARGMYTFTPAQLSSLSAIAAQCPDTGGEGVYLARSLYNMVNAAMWDEDCSAAVAREMPTTPTIPPTIPPQSPQRGEVVVFPNPNTGEVNVSFGETHSNRTVQITTALGVKVYQEKQLETNARINLSLPNGTYFIQIIEDGVVKTTQPLLLLRP